MLQLNYLISQLVLWNLCFTRLSVYRLKLKFYFSSVCVCVYKVKTLQSKTDNTNNMNIDTGEEELCLSYLLLHVEGR